MALTSAAACSKAEDFIAAVAAAVAAFSGAAAAKAAKVRPARSVAVQKPH